MAVITLAANLQLAASQIGYVEGGGPDGRSGNITKYWAEMNPSCQGQPWCCCFGPTWQMFHAGGSAMISNTKYYYCPYLENYARQNGQWGSVPRAGAYVLYSFGEALAVHIGLVEKVGTGSNGVPSGYIQAIEGNTSSGNSGSQNNGGGVYRRIRPANWGIRGYFYPKYGTTGPVAPPKPPAPTKPGQITPVDLVVDGALGGLTIRAMQRWVGVADDGVWGPLSKMALQRKVGATPDGVVGPATIKALQRVVGAVQDGSWGPATTKAIQRYLNAR
jgi:hypothetical protein